MAWDKLDAQGTEVQTNATGPDIEYELIADAFDDHEPTCKEHVGRLNA